MKTTDAITWAPEVAATSPGLAPSGRSPGDPLGVLIDHLRAHPRVHAAAFLVVGPERDRVEPATGWFASPLLREALGAILGGNHGDRLPGLVEATLERDRPLFLPRVEDWQAATGLHAQIERGVDPVRAAHAWRALRRASLIGCPVRTTLGRALGVLIVASVDPDRPLLRSDLDTVEVLADLAALAQERSEMLAAESARARQELLLKRAAEGTAGSLEIPEVEQRVADHALRLIGADQAELSRLRPDGGRLASTASAGRTGGADPAGLDAGTLAAVVRTRRPVREGGATPSAHVPIELGHRLFGVLSVTRRSGPGFETHEIELLQTLARMSAAAMANALDFERERRIARALTRGFVPDSLPEVPGYEMGLLYEPSQSQPAGGDLYGAWTLPGGEVGLLVGDVAGKGVESAALSAMARFFIEARSWDCGSPAEVLAQAGRMLRDRLPSDTFVTAFFGLLGEDSLSYANAGHLAPLVLRASGELHQAGGHGLPLGIDECPSYEVHELALEPGDLVLGFTDGLVEARREGELLGDERLRALVTDVRRRARDVQDLVRSLHHEVGQWAGGLSDDVVLIALRRRPG